MARDYYRPELSADDLKLMLAGRILAINPTRADTARCIKATEKGCRKNKLDVSEAEAAWTRVSNDEALVAGAGRWVCPKQYHYDMRGTVIVFARISDSLIGMSCERQVILAGKKSEIPMIGFDEVRVEKQPIQWFNRIAELFWTHLSEDEIADLKQQAALAYLSTLTNGFPKEWQQNRANNLQVLQGLQDPENTTELQLAGKRIATELWQGGHEKISWRELKQREPGITARYQRELLEIMDGGVLSTNDLASLPDQSPFRLRFSVWRGAERIFRVPQLVLEVEAYDLLKELRFGTKEQQEVANFIIGTAGYKWHPGQSNCVGWIRVHIDDENKLCFVDEVQSDTVEELSTYLRDNLSDLSSAQICSIKDYLHAVKKWHVHGMSCLMQWVSEIDYDLGMHSLESAKVSKYGMTPSDRKWNTYYGAFSKRYSMQLKEVEGYPAPIWVTNKNTSEQLVKKAS